MARKTGKTEERSEWLIEVGRTKERAVNQNHTKKLFPVGTQEDWEACLSELTWREIV